jgi:hypothetical protein
MKRHSYKLALRAKGIRPLPPYRQLRSAYQGGQEIFDPAHAQPPATVLQPQLRGGVPQRNEPKSAGSMGLPTDLETCLMGSK